MYNYKPWINHYYKTNKKLNILLIHHNILLLNLKWERVKQNSYYNKLINTRLSLLYHLGVHSLVTLVIN